MEKSLAVKFYKNPKSPFPSGEANRKDLEKNWVQDFAEYSYLVQKEKRQFWVKSTSIARDLQLSRFVFSSRNQKTYRVLQTSNDSLLAIAENSTTPEWLPLSDLTPLPQDTGCAWTLTSTQLRESPSWKSDSVLSVPAGSRLVIQKVDDTWALVTFESVGRITGWVDLNNLLLKHDFAAFALIDKQTWTPVLYREGADLITSEKKRIPLSEIKGLITKPDLGISIVTSDSEKLLLRQNLTLLKTDFQTWSLSKISGHGDVYWRKTTTATAAEAHLADGISIEELMKREVVSVSFHPKNPNLALASAQGIFLTTDGKTWNKLLNFKNQDFPVLVDSDSNLYVGSQRSSDLGLKFFPFFRWENLTPLLEQRQKRAVQELKIRQLSSPRPGILRMEVETNAGRVALAARTQASIIQKWDFD
ncbi:MAG: hypothetical protein ACAH59_10800 [Pseudobdellovibrionaceae bacterium]